MSGEKSCESASNHNAALGSPALEHVQKLQLIFDKLPAFISYIGQDRRYRYCNQAYSRLLGRPNAEIVGKLSRDLLDQVAWTVIEPNLTKALGGQVAEFDIEGLDDETGKRWFHVVYTPDLNKAGEVAGVVVLVTDITDRKKAEVALRRSQESFAIMFRSLPIAVAISRLTDGTIVDMNPEFVRLTGFKREEMIGKTSADLGLNPDHEGRARVLEELKRDGIAAPAQFRVYPKGAPPREVVSHVRVVEMAGESFALSSIVDLTERKQIEEELAEANRVLKAIIAASPLAILVLDLEGRIETWNPAAEQLFGWTADEARGKVFPAVTADKTGELRANISKTLASDGIFGLEIQRVNRAGEKLDLRLWTGALRNAEGVPVGAIGILEDIRERKREEAQKLQVQVEMASLNLRLQRAMMETHHRVKNNLQMMAALLDLVRMRHSENIPGSELDRIVGHLKSLSAIHELLTLQAKLDPEAESIETRDTLAKLLPLVQQVAGERQITANVDNVELPVRYATSLAVLVNELVSNAVKHTPGNIELSLTSNDSGLRLEVSDDGRGFPAGFDPRSGATTGLELVESVARMELGGTTAYENREGGGARVVVEFPIPTDSGEFPAL